jgi:aldehyde:ferredoxin oxidoreductase
MKYLIHIKGVPLSSYDPRTLKGASLGAATSTRGADHLRSLPTIEAYGKNYYSVDDKETLRSELDLPETLVQNIFDLDLLNPTKYEGKEHLVKYFQENNCFSDSVGTCRFSSSWRFGIGPTWLSELVSSFLGVTISPQEILKIGERGYAIEMELLKRSNFLSETDKLPLRFYSDPLPPSGEKIDYEKFEQLKKKYYQLCEYDIATGRPTDNLLKKLLIY